MITKLESENNEKCASFVFKSALIPIDNLFPTSTLHASFGALVAIKSN